MHRDYVNQLENGEPLWGFLQFTSNGEEVRVPGQIRVSASGYAEVEIVLEEVSPLAMSEFHTLKINEKRIAPVAVPSVATFDSVGGFLTLIDMGDPIRGGQVWGRPRTATYYPRFTVNQHLEEPYWARPELLRFESEAFELWAYDGFITQSSEISDAPKSNRSTREVTLTTWIPPRAEFQLEDGSDSPTIRFGAHPQSSNSKDQSTIGVRIHSFIELEPKKEHDWTHALSVLHSFHNVIELCHGKVSSAVGYRENLSKTPRTTLTSSSRLGCRPRPS